MRRIGPAHVFLIISLMSIPACGSGGEGGVAAVIGPPGGTEGGSAGEPSGGPSDPPEEIEGNIKLAWDSNTEADIEGYFIYYGTGSGVYEHRLDVGMADPIPRDVTTYTLRGLVKGQTYFLAVTAYNTSNQESGFSNEVSGAAGGS